MNRILPMTPIKLIPETSGTEWCAEISLPCFFEEMRKRFIKWRKSNAKCRIHSRSVNAFVSAWEIKRPNKPNLTTAPVSGLTTSKDGLMLRNLSNPGGHYPDDQVSLEFWNLIFYDHNTQYQHQYAFAIRQYCILFAIYTSFPSVGMPHPSQTFARPFCPSSWHARTAERTDLHLVLAWHPQQKES